MVNKGTGFKVTQVGIPVLTHGEVTLLTFLACIMAKIPILFQYLETL
jgi:hypothetical protein